MCALIIQSLNNTRIHGKIPDYMGAFGSYKTVSKKNRTYPQQRPLSRLHGKAFTTHSDTDIPKTYYPNSIQRYVATSQHISPHPSFYVCTHNTISQ